MIQDIAEKVRSSDALMRDFTALCDAGGRFARTESEAKAVAYLRRRLEEATGVAPAEAEIDYSGWSRGAASIERLGGGGVLPCVSLVRSPPTPPGGLTAEIIDIGRGTESDFAEHAAAIKGRIVMVRHEYMFSSETVHRRRKYQWAIDRGAAGFLIACHVPGAGPVTGSSGATPERGIPSAGISAETAATLTRTGAGKVRFIIEAHEAPRQTANLFLDLPGKKPEWVVLSAHIDGHHLAESAMDNATGVAAVLSIAEAMAPHVARMERGLRIALFTVEEWALAGSQAYVDGLSETERDAIKVNLNLDTLAGSSRLTALTSGFAKLEAWLLERARAHAFTLDAYRPVMANSDHYNFARHGVPAMRLVAGFDDDKSEINYVLTPGDTREKVSESDLRNASALAAILAAEACQAAKLELR